MTPLLPSLRLWVGLRSRQREKVDSRWLLPRIYGHIILILWVTARLTRRSDDDGDYDDDNFIVPDDSEDDVASRSSRASKRSSRQSLLSNYEDEDVGSQTTKTKKSAATTGRPSLKNAGSANTSTNNFLTAAERRAQAMKEGKKSQEDPFSFLLDVRDVGCMIIILAASVDARYPLCRKMVSDQESLVMIPGHYMYLRKLGMTSVLSRNRCARLLWNQHCTWWNAHFQFWEIKQNHFDTVAYSTYLVTLILELTRFLDFVLPKRVSYDYAVITQKVNTLSSSHSKFLEVWSFPIQSSRDPWLTYY